MEKQFSKKSNFTKIRNFRNGEISCIKDEDGFLGRGTYGTVLCGFTQRLGVIAIKCLKLIGAKRKQAITKQKIEEEIELVQQACHKNVVQVYGWTQWNGYIGIIMEYFPAGNLMETLKDSDVTLLPLLRLRICYDVSNGIAFIHNYSSHSKLVHGDIKPENILLTEDLHCKIADFGSAKLSSYTDDFSSTQSHQGSGNNPYTALYAAPEVLENPTIPLKPSRDTFSFAVLMLMVLRKGELTFSSHHMSLYLETVKKGKRPDVSNIDSIIDSYEEKNQKDDASIMERMKDIMVKCWGQNPLNRPLMTAVRDELNEELNKFPFSKMLQCLTVAVENIPMLKPSRATPSFPLHQFSDYHNDSGSASVQSSATASSFLSAGSSNNSLHSQSTVEASNENIPSSTELRLFVDEKFLSMENLLSQNKIDEAADQAMQCILTSNVSLINDGVTSIIDKTIEISESFREHNKFIISFQLICWIVELCDKVTDAEVKLTKINDMYRIIYYDAWELYQGQDSRTNDIEELCLPTLRLLKNKIEVIQSKDAQHKAVVQTKCLLCIGWCYYFTGKFAEAKKKGQTGQKRITEAYSENSKKSKVFAGCHILIASASHEMDNYVEAEEQYNKCIELYKSAEDIDEYERKERLATAKEKLEQVKKHKLSEYMMIRFRV